MGKDRDKYITNFSKKKQKKTYKKKFTELANKEIIRCQILNNNQIIQIRTMKYLSCFRLTKSKYSSLEYVWVPGILSHLKTISCTTYFKTPTMPSL